MKVLDLGLRPYAEVYQMQKKLVAEKKEEVLLLVEHEPVYTYGRRTKETLSHLPYPIFEIERGGEITFHNPGQLVAYPILFLKEGERDLHLHLRRLEETIIHTLHFFGILGSTKAKATGVWVQEQEKKIASLGIAVSQWTTYHGCALNVKNDLSGFFAIHPCGFAPEIMTSMEQFNSRTFEMIEIKAQFIKDFCTVFGRSI